jgi:opacity protein-like surface antigen
LAIPKLQACLNPAGGFLNAITASDTRLGGMVGFGTEFALARNWSAKGEVDWIDFGNKTLTASDGTAFGAKMTLIETKVGVNYHLAP